MRGARSSGPSPVKLTNFHIVVTSLAALAGVALAAYQTLGPKEGGQLPVNVTVALEAPHADMTVAKSDAETIGMSAFDLGRGASFTAALKDGADLRYSFADLFDGDPHSYLTITAPDRELNVQVIFNSPRPEPVTAIEYAPPPGADPAKLATVVDLMVLPDGQLEASGRPIMSFSLQRSPGSQTLAIPGNAAGKGLWLRIAGPEGVDGTVVGDFKGLQEQVTR